MQRYFRNFDEIWPDAVTSRPLTLPEGAYDTDEVKRDRASISESEIESDSLASQVSIKVQTPGLLFIHS